MKIAILGSALAAGLTFAAPASAEVLSAGVSVNDGRAAGHLTLIDHDRRIHRRHYGRGHGRFGRCQSWRFVHRKLHRRFEHVRLQRTVHNRRGHRIFIAHARNHRGRPFRIRYNACLGRVMRVNPLRGRYYRDRHHPRRQDGHYRRDRRY